MLYLSYAGYKIEEIFQEGDFVKACYSHITNYLYVNHKDKSVYSSRSHPVSENEYFLVLNNYGKNYSWEYAGDDLLCVLSTKTLKKLHCISCSFHKSYKLTCQNY